ncbi:TetR/AcrR family transcriptional repressor of nem operon [Planomicrobium koreense]|uniref:TetR/AcrR family transcriptional repressor of nem operon n=1 Tax=Planococcus koreensis TaxID=112331 RepID=A0A7W8FW66_9BACL|nr:TetR/AcrR family transcriptional regulator [Planococcus koreensis]MBB5181582.1 TetR/AcrR family transcriptional repressor of nem operon [Planococcus koreensis]
MGRHKAFDEKEVLKKAMELFWKQGYEKTSLQDLVDHMGIHRRSIYDTFGDKRALFLMSLAYYEEMLTNDLVKLMNAGGPSKEAIREVFSFTLNTAEYYPKGCLAVNAAVELSLLDKEIAQISTELFKKTERVFRYLIMKGQTSGELSKEIDPDAMSRFLHNNLLGLRVLIKTNYTKEELESIVDLTLSVLN